MVTLRQISVDDPIYARADEWRRASERAGQRNGIRSATVHDEVALTIQAPN